MRPAAFFANERCKGTTHCAALRTKIEDGMGGCSTWCRGFVKYQRQSCPSIDPPSNVDNCQKDVEVYEVTNNMYTDLSCPTTMNPTWYTTLDSKICCT
mmetsp:Transcript_7127/g.11361  ORF Transcript_7127/g.11361 Transcript_7127/m.11361 type:complete len:98 (-) Transcript_7127:467-760(-)